MANATVNKEGKIEDVVLVHGLGYGLDENAVKILSTWGCKPATLDGKPFPVRVQFSVKFKLF
jgi:TonB family protein